MQQVKLKRNNKYRIAWVDQDVNAGDTCTLKDEDGLFDVVETYQYKDRDQINRAWRVGGIDNNLV